LKIPSPDGIHWDDRDHIEPVSRRANEGSFNVTYDGIDQVYRAYSITRYPYENNRRIICYTESPSLVGPWKDSQPMLEPDCWDDEIARRDYGALRAEFHNMSAFRYGNLHIGLLGVLYVTAEMIPNQKNQMPCDGPIDSVFVYSRDGINWEHADRDRTPAISRGDGDNFDRGMILGVAKEPIIDGDEIHWYYTGCEHTHGQQDMEKRVKRLGRATWRRDRFVALHAESEGMVTTRPFLPPGNATHLEVNADASGGQISVEVCDPNGNVLDGFCRDESIPLTADDLRWQVKWRSAEIRDLTGPVKLRFYLNKSAIYSFSICTV